MIMNKSTGVEVSIILSPTGTASRHFPVLSTVVRRIFVAVDDGQTNFVLFDLSVWPSTCDSLCSGRVG